MTGFRSLSEVAERAAAFFRTGQTRDVEWREVELRDLLEWIERNEEKILTALYQDLGKPPFEAYGSEILSVKQEIRYFLKHLQKWARNESVRPPWYLWPARSWIQREPFGAVLILVPWNYPFYLALMPLVAAIAAGNTVVIKPSELAPNSAAVLEELVRALEPGLASVVTGDAETARALLEQPFDFIFYTGGNVVGKKVAVAAAEKGVPCVLELGGKNPCLVDQGVPLEITARRIVWAKFFNAGQTCVAPDHVYVHRSQYESLLEELGKAIGDFYGDHPLQSADYGRLIHARHFERLRGFLSSGRIVHGGRYDVGALRLEPTVMVDIPVDAAVMKEEIFGPILPVIPYDNLDAVLDDLRDKPAPLALYLHTTSLCTEIRVVQETRSGSVCINDHILQASIHELPFGGVGASGIGSYHGRQGYETFTHPRSVMRQSSWIDNALRYPPAGNKLRWIKRLIG